MDSGFARASNSEPLEVKLYSAPKRHLYLAASCLFLFLSMTVAGITLPLINPNGSFARPNLTAVFFGCFWGGWTILSIYAIIAYRKERVYTSGLAVHMDSVFHTNTLPLDEIAKVVWRGWPAGGSLVLYSSSRRVAIHFKNYENGIELAAFFRASLPDSIQTGYERFESTCVRTSRAFTNRQVREMRNSRLILPVCGALLICLSVWSP